MSHQREKAVTTTLTSPSAIAASIKPQARCGPSFKCPPSPKSLALQLPMVLRCADSESPATASLQSSTVSEQQATRNERFRSPTSSRASAATVAAWLTSKIRLCTPAKRRCTSGMRTDRKPARRSCRATRSSPLRDGYHTEDQESSISGK